MAGSLHHTTVGVSDYSQKADLIDELMEGIENCKVTIIHYQSSSATEPVEYEVYPYGLTYHRGSLYLIAHSSDHKKVLHFKVNRIEDAAAGPFIFEPPEEFSLEDHSGRFVWRFSRRRRRDSQGAVPAAGGDIRC